MASTEVMREALVKAEANAEAAKIMRQLAEREVARYTEALTEAMRRLVAAEKTEDEAMYAAEYAHEAMQDADIAQHEEYLATLNEW